MTGSLSSHAPTDTQRRYLALWFPFLATERQARQCDDRREPLVLVAHTGNTVRISAASRIAIARGLTPGLTLADARARVPDLIAVAADPEADGRLLARLAAWCDRFTPLAALDGTAGLMLDVTGAAHLFGGEAALRAAVLEGLARAGFGACATIAGTPEAAAALARFGQTAIVAPGGDADAVAPLPVAALEAGADTIRALRRAGLATIGALARRPSANLTARFGRALTTRLRRMCGRENARFTPLRPLAPCRADRRFAEPLREAGALEAILGELLEETAAELERRGEGGLAFEARFFRADGEVRHIAVETGRASREAAAIRRLFAERMAALADPIDPGFGFDAMRLSVLQTAPLGVAQADLETETSGGEALAALVARLTARFGHDRVQRFAPEDTHMPERAARRVSALRPGGGAPWPAPVPGEPPLRPLQMFDPPHPIEVPAAPFPDGPPGRFRWRRAMHDVAAAEGPERIAPEWWRGGETMTRDYYRVEDSEGRRFWIYRRGLFGRETNEPAWYLHGLFA